MRRVHLDVKARLGFVGLGTMGGDLLEQARGNPKIEVAALCDIEPVALDKAARSCVNKPAQYNNHRVMLAKEKLDGVVVAVPQHLHAAISIDALDAGVNTFCEKPMGLSVAQCEAMLAAAQRNGKALMIGQVLRYIGVYRYVLELTRSGELGKPFAVRIIRTMGLWGSWGRPWRLKRETCGGMLLEINAHEIDFMRCILGEAASVSATGNRFNNLENDYEDLIFAQIVFANGGMGSLTAAACDYMGRYTGEVFCEKGTIYYDSVAKTLHVQRDGTEKEVVAYDDVHPEWENGVYREIREFAETCMGEHPATIPGEEGLRNVEIAEACYQSIREGRPVSLPLK